MAAAVSGWALAVDPLAAGGAARRLATAAVRLATRPPCRARKPPGVLACATAAEPAPDADARLAGAPADSAGLAARPAEAGVARRAPDLPCVTAGLAAAPAEPGPATGDCSGSLRRIASARRSAVTGPGAESGALGTALPAPATDGFAEEAAETAGTGRAVAAPAGKDELTGSAADCRTAADARAADRRSAAATPPPLCWETAPALAARAGVESPLPVGFPGGAEPDPERAGPGAPGELAPPPGADDAAGASRGGRNLRCSCELVIGPAAVTSSIRRTGMAVDTSPPAMVPGERGCSSVGTCRAARAKPRGGKAVTAGRAVSSATSAEELDRPGVHQRGGRTSACPVERADTVEAAARARRTATGRAVAAANRADDAATSPRLAARASAAGRPGRRSRWAAARPSAVRST